MSGCFSLPRDFYLSNILFSIRGVKLLILPIKPIKVCWPVYLLQHNDGICYFGKGGGVTAVDIN